MVIVRRKKSVPLLDMYFLVSKRRAPGGDLQSVPKTVVQDPVEDLLLNYNIYMNSTKYLMMTYILIEFEKSQQVFIFLMTSASFVICMTRKIS